MTKLHPEVKIEIKAGRALPSSPDPGHNWAAFRNGKPIGAGWAPGSVADAFEDAIDDLRMLGLVETEEPTRAKIKVTIRPGHSGPHVTLRPLAFIEGPRAIGYCVGCKQLCQGMSPKCDVRVFSEAERIRAGKSVK